MGQLFRALLFFVVLLGTCWGQVFAQHKDSLVVQVTNDVSKLQNLNDFLYILEDTTNALTFQQVRSPQGQKQFVPYTAFHEKNPRLKKKRAYWAKITFRNQSDRNHWILSSGAASYIELYIPTKDGKYQKKLNGRLVAASKRDVKSNSNAAGRYQFHIFLPTERSSTVFIKLLGTVYTPKYDLKVIIPEVFLNELSQSRTIQSIFQGAVWVIVLYNLILFFFAKDSVYLYYLLYALCYSIYYFSYYDLYNEYPYYFMFIVLVVVQAIMLFYFLFMRAFTNTAVLMPKWDGRIVLWIKIKVGLMILLLGHLIITFDVIMSELLGSIVSIIDIIFFAITLVLLFRGKGILIKYYAFGASFLLLGIVLAALAFSGIIPSEQENYFSQAGVLLELIFFSAGLGYRERKNEQDKRLAQAENARILKEQKEVLEQSVTARTKEIREQKEEIVQQSEELKAAYDQLNQLGQFKNHMTDMIVHDLKNPLASIIGIATTHEEGRLDKAKLTSTAQHMMYMLQNLLDIQRAEAAEVQFNIAKVEMGAVIKEVIAQQRILAAAKNINLRYDALLGDVVKADADILVRILSNLISNAIKFTPENGEISLLSGYVEEATLLKIEVQDTGVGIPQNQLSRIFDKFYSIEQGQRGNFRSTGLGLTFCKMAVENLGGTIGVVSKEGFGTTFWFTLPLVVKAGEGAIAPLEDASNPILEEVVKVKEALQGQDLELAQVIVQQIRKEGVNHSYPTRLARIFDTVKAKMAVPPAVEAWMQMLLMDASNEIIFEDLLQLDNQ